MARQTSVQKKAAKWGEKQKILAKKPFCSPPTVPTEPETYFFVFLDLKIRGGSLVPPGRTLGSRVGGGNAHIGHIYIYIYIYI